MNRYPVIRWPRHLSRYPILLLTLALIPLCCGAAPIHAVFGEDIPLGGAAPGSDTVYLFLTGPNLPDGGISLAGGTPVTTGVPASFTRVVVQTDDTWSYTWRTGSTGRILDPGTYTIYAVNQPLSRRDLDDSAYSTRAVIFGSPEETVTVTVEETVGSLSVDSSPGMSLVTLDGRTAGITPLVISGIPAGSHTLVVTHDGYSAYRTDFVISAGEEREISAVLQPLTATPPGQGTVPPATASSGRLAIPSPVAIGAVVIGVLALHYRRQIQRDSRETE
ncbi:MAG: PEGA domain-containing protein [Methanomicrobiales archaeon]|nr:PEGA domain-containing protein [Methanomicrobiales archaeon]